MAKSAEAEVEKLKILEARIRAPSIWGRVPCGIRFEDLQDKRYDEAVMLLKKHYLNEEVIYKTVNLSEDPEAVSEYANQARIWLKDKMSIAAVKDGTDKLIGILVIRIQEKHAFSRTFSRVKITHNPVYTTVNNFLRDVEQPVNLFEELGVKRYFKIYALALKPRYRHRGIAKEMLNSAIAESMSASVPAIAGIFCTARSQQIASELGFVKYHELYYVKYIKNDEIVFFDTGPGNHGAALMAYRIPGVEEPAEVQRQASSRLQMSAGFGVEDDDEANGNDDDESKE